MGNQILVCKPGFCDEGCYKGPSSGGAAYVKGFMFIPTEGGAFTPAVRPDFVFWNGGRGVFSQALREATEDEAKAFGEGVRFVQDIKTVYPIYI